MMKKKELELFLEGVYNFSSPKPWLEQYKTPASIASDMLFLAYGFQDIYKKTVLDLGCGTGVFAVGARMLQAAHVTAVDIDPDSVMQGQMFAKENDLDIDFICADISSVSEHADTVLMNPPFGAQKANLHADRLFIEKATSIATITYSLHLAHTMDFIEKLLRSLDKKGRVLQTYRFPISAQFHFHKKLKDTVSVALLQIK